MKKVTELLRKGEAVQVFDPLLDRGFDCEKGKSYQFSEVCQVDLLRDDPEGWSEVVAAAEHDRPAAAPLFSLDATDKPAKGGL